MTITNIWILLKQHYIMPPFKHALCTGNASGTTAQYAHFRLSMASRKSTPFCSSSPADQGLSTVWRIGRDITNAGKLVTCSCVLCPDGLIVPPVYVLAFILLTSVDSLSDRTTWSGQVTAYGTNTTLTGAGRHVGSRLATSCSLIQ